jgi:hypothetical protein
VDLVAFLVGVDQEFVAAEHVVIEPIAGGEPEDGVEILPQLVPRVQPRQRADAGIVIDELARLSCARSDRASAYGDVLADLITGAVAADDDVLHEVPRCYLSEHSSNSWKRTCLDVPVVFHKS